MCGSKEVYTFPHTTYPYIYTHLVSLLFVHFLYIYIYIIIYNNNNNNKY